MIEQLKKLVFNKSFLLGLIVAIGVFSKYIFGDDNLLEEFSEFFVFENTGQNVDFSPNSKEGPSSTLWVKP